MRARSQFRAKATAAASLASVSLAALLAGMPQAAAEECTGHAAPPADIATPSMLYETLRAHANVELLAVGFQRKPVEQTCTWVYEVKVLTAAGSVVELDFDAKGLDLVGARGPDNDRDAAALVKNFGGDSAILTTGTAKDNSSSRGTASNSGGGSGHGGSDDSGEGGDDGGDDAGGGEGGNSGSAGGGNSGSGGGDDGGGEGGSSGSGG